MILLGIILLFSGVFLLWNYRIVDKYKPFYLYVVCFLVTMGIILTIQPILSNIHEKKEDANLEISDIYIYTEDNHMNCNFKLENHDDHAWYYIKVRVDFKNENGDTIISKEQTLVGREGLSLYKYYTISTELNSSIKDASVYVIDYRNKNY